MSSLFTILFYIGLVLASLLARRTHSGWPSTVMILGSLISMISRIMFYTSLDDLNYRFIEVLVILLYVNFAGLLLFAIGFLGYTFQAYATAKSNKQLEYLNYQLKDQLAIQEKQQAQQEA